jgi:purine nucleosidase
MHKVIYDTDPGVDDAMALLFLHRHPDIELIGVTTIFGNASVDTTTRNALFLKQEWGFDCPVARGADATFDPSRQEHGWPTHVHGVNGLGDINVPETIDLPVDPRPAYQFIIDTVRAHPGEVRLVAVGRMTNLALALKHDPEIVKLVKDVVIMGGSFYVPGNVSPVAEANIHGDPEAADVVMTAAWNVVLIGLDVTAITTMSRSYLADMAKIGGKDVQLLADLSQSYIDFYKHAVDDGMMVHDSCASRAGTVHDDHRCRARRLRRHRRRPDDRQAGRQALSAGRLGWPAEPDGVYWDRVGEGRGSDPGCDSGRLRAH